MADHVNAFKLRRSSVAGKVPTIDNLPERELAMNLADARVFFSTGAIVKALANLDDLTWAKLGGKPTTLADLGVTDVYTKTSIDSALAALGLSAVQLRRTTTLTLSTTRTDITFNVADLENNSSVLEHGTTTSQIVAHVAGLYLVSFECEVINTTNANIDYVQIKKNGVALANGLITVNCRSTRQHPSKTVPIVLAANDYITVEAYSSTGTTGIIQIGATLSVLSLQGPKGADGAQGPAGPAGPAGGDASIYYPAATFDNPNNSNWAVNALAPVSSDTTTPSLLVRSFDDTAEEGIGCTIYVPPTATEITLTIMGKAASAPMTALATILRLYSRLIPYGSAVGAWSAPVQLNALNIGANVYFQKYTQTFSLSALGMTAGNTYQIELTRYGASASDTLVGDFSILNMIFSFA